mgnify:CR=1 FL=1
MMLLLARFGVNPNPLKRLERSDHELINALKKNLRPREKDQGKTSLWDVRPDVRRFVLVGVAAKAKRLDQRDFLAFPLEWLKKHGFKVEQSDARQSFDCIKHHHYLLHLHSEEEVERLATATVQALRNGPGVDGFPRIRVRVREIRKMLLEVNNECELPQHERDGLQNWVVQELGKAESHP